MKSSFVTIKSLDVTIELLRVTIQSLDVMIELSRKTIELSRVTIESSRMLIQLSDVTIALSHLPIASTRPPIASSRVEITSAFVEIGYVWARSLLFLNQTLPAFLTARSKIPLKRPHGRVTRRGSSPAQSASIARRFGHYDDRYDHHTRLDMPRHGEPGARFLSLVRSVTDGTALAISQADVSD
jgi:hypothetical protein